MMGRTLAIPIYKALPCFVIIRSKLFCTQDGVSAVYAASQEGHTDVVELLVQAGADIHLATTDEVSDDVTQSPLQYRTTVCVRH